MVNIYFLRLGYVGIIVLFTLGCPTMKTDVIDTPFHFDKPNKSIVLYTPLKEISGLAYGNNHLYAIQDEDGILFSWESSAITSRPDTIHFSGKSDYEGITFIDSSIYIITSQAKLRTYNLRTYEVDKIDIGISKNHNIEGLVYDPERNGLWIASKEDKSDVVKKIYFYDLLMNKIDKDQSILVDLGKIKNFGQTLYPGFVHSGKWINYQFNPSGIAIHPITQELYILSSPLPQILILDNTLNMKQLFFLDPSIHRQPEGITFDDLGNLYIANEGQAGKGYLCLFYPISK